MIKKAFTLFLALLLLLVSARDLVTIAAFKWQQDIIAATLCVNRFEPVPMCAGQCFLEEELKESKEQEQGSAAGQQLTISEKPVYFQAPLPESPARITVPLISNPCFTYLPLQADPALRSVFQPPRLV